MALAELTPRAPELHARIDQILKETEDEVVQMERNGADEGDVQVKKGLVEQYKLLKEKYSDKEGEGSPGLQWIISAAFASVPSGFFFFFFVCVYGH